MFYADYGLAHTFVFTLLKAGATTLAVTGDWTPATGDAKISKDAGNAANTSANPAAIGGTGSVGWSIALTSTEMAANKVLLQIVDAAVQDQSFVISTVAPGVMRQGSATSGGAATLTDTGLSLTTDEAAGCVLEKYDSDGTDRESRIVISNTATAFTVASNWATQPTSASRYRLFAFGSVPASTTNPAPADVRQWLGTAAATPTVAGVPEVDITHVNGAAVSTSTAQFGVNAVQGGGTAWNSGAIGAATLAGNALTADKVDPGVGTEIAAAVLTVAMTESYAADGAAPTVAQALFGIQQFLQERAISGVTMTVKKLDGATTAMTLTMNDATSPMTITRAT